MFSPVHSRYRQSFSLGASIGDWLTSVNQYAAQMAADATRKAQIIGDVRNIQTEIQSLFAFLEETNDSFRPAVLKNVLSIVTFNIYEPDFERMYQYYTHMADALKEMTEVIFDKFEELTEKGISQKDLAFYLVKHQALLDAHKKFVAESQKVAAAPGEYFKTFQDSSILQSALDGVKNIGGSLGETIGNILSGLFSSPVMWVGAGLAVYLIFFRKNTQTVVVPSGKDA